MRAKPAYFVILALLLVSAACNSDVAGPGEDGGDGSEEPNAVVPYTGGIRIGWDFRTRMRLFDGPASYPRMIRLQGGDLLCSVESRGQSYVLISEDDGATWTDPIVAASA